MNTVFESDVTVLESCLFNAKLNFLLSMKEVDDFFLTGKPGAIRDAYKCCNEFIADLMIEMADLKEGDNVLEPGAGKGVILKKLVTYKNHHYCEINKEFVDDYLKPVSRNFLASDFLAYTFQGFQKIIINPPFSYQQYAAHILHAYDLLLPGGILVALYPKNAHNLIITNHAFLKFIANGEHTEVGNVCGEDTPCVIFKIVKP